MILKTSLIVTIICFIIILVIKVYLGSSTFSAITFSLIISTIVLLFLSPLSENKSISNTESGIYFSYLSISFCVTQLYALYYSFSDSTKSLTSVLT